MSLYFESLKPITKNCTIERWRSHSLKMRKILDGKDHSCRELRNDSRKLRYNIAVSKAWETYFNNIKLQDRIRDIELLVKYAENTLERIAKEKKLLEEEKFQTEALFQKCDTWISICMECLNCLDKKLENELTRNDNGIIESKKEIKLLDESKANLKEECLLAWEMAGKLEDIETKIELNLEFKKEVLVIEERCLSIQKMDTGVSYKVDPTHGPKKTLTIEEWSNIVYELFEKGQTTIHESTKLRERMCGARKMIINEYSIQFEKTDYEMRKRIYEINREKNESQFQHLKVLEMQAATKAETDRLSQFLVEVKHDLRCAHTRCSDRFFRPSVEATMDSPFFGLNKEVTELEANVESIEGYLDMLRSYHNQLEKDAHKLSLDIDAKSKSLQVQIQALDIRIAERYDPKKIYAYNRDCLIPRMVTQMPPPFSLYSNKL